MHGIIDRGDRSVHHSSRALLEADSVSVKAFMTRHPQLQRQCQLEALLIDCYDMLKQSFEFWKSFVGLRPTGCWTPSLFCLCTR